MIYVQHNPSQRDGTNSTDGDSYRQDSVGIQMLESSHGCGKQHVSGDDDDEPRIEIGIALSSVIQIYINCEPLLKVQVFSVEISQSRERKAAFNQLHVEQGHVETALTKIA